MVEPVVAVAGVAPEAEDDVLDVEVCGIGQLRQTDPATLAVLATLANALRLAGLESLTGVAESFDGHGLAEFTLVDLLGADQDLPTVRLDDRRVDHLVHVLLVRDDVAEGLVADAERVADTALVGVAERFQLVGRDADEPGPAVRSLHDPLAVRDGVRRCHLHVVPRELGAHALELGQVVLELPVVVDVRTSFEGVRHLNHLLLRYTD